MGADPSTKLLLEASRAPGGDWERRGVVLEPGSSGQALVVEGVPTLLYVGARGRMMQALRQGEEWRASPLRLEGEGRGMAVDPAAVPLPSGGYRLFYTYNERWEDPGFSEHNEIHSAFSADASTWRREPGIRLQGARLADPDPVAVPGGFRLFYTRNANSVESAFAADGLEFRPEGVVLSNATVSATRPVSQGWEMLFQREGRIFRATSEDGRTFREDPEPLLGPSSRGPDRIHLESPSAVTLPDQRTLLLYSAPPPEDHRAP